MERSYRLKGTDGNIRLLQFSPDSTSLYFTTTLLNAVQLYSLNHASLLAPGPTHHSAPTVLAVSPTSHLLLTASESPPTVYLQSLKTGGQPVFLQPHASRTPVTLAAFHPERPDIFLLAFKDGTLAIYDASQIVRAGLQAAKIVEGCEISVFQNLHRVVSYGIDEVAVCDSTGARSSGITGAAFFPAFKNRAISVGANGKCNVLDFEKSKIVRTWSTKGAATSVSVISLDVGKTAVKRSATRLVRTTSAAMPNLIIAVGRADGKVMIFDASGAILLEQTVNDNAKRVVDVEWIRGTTPRTVGQPKTLQFSNEIFIELYQFDGTLRSRQSHPTTESDPSSPELEPPVPAEDKRQTSSIYPEDTTPIDADAFSTVKHHEMKGHVHRDLPAALAHDYMDLFSPVKQMRQKTPLPVRPSPKRRATPRPRPRISSSTFIDQAAKATSSNDPAKRTQIEPPVMSGALPPRKSRTIPFALEKKLASSPTRFKAPAKKSQVASGSHGPGKMSIPGPSGNTRVSLETQSSSSSGHSTANSKILADIKRFGETGTWSSNAKGGNTALLAPYMPARTTKSSLRALEPVPLPEPAQRQHSARKSSKDQLAKESDRQFVFHREVDPDVRAVDTDDIWLTADSDTDDRASKMIPKRGLPDPKLPRRPTWRGGPTWTSIEVEALRERETSPSHAQHNTIHAAKPNIEGDLRKRRGSVRLDLAPPRFAPKAAHIETSVVPAALIPHTLSPSLSPPSGRDSSPGDTSFAFDESDYSPMHHPKRRHSRTPRVPPPELPLPPGFAQSYQGPVDVGSYLPRKGSLAAFVEPLLEGEGRRTVLGDVSGNGRRGVRRKSHKHRHNQECTGCGELKDEVERLKGELAELRRLIKGKDRVV
ncbi:WD40 repeat-like protein [Tothia fuscella]|uniref:WD40 repeat-like protein n=1 Tax=Tothia fuscella TaxID=1048955 RepID=A0A9P4P3Z6_9PEZI|nr:WD40 repeat-like protein [Tothia fuscella]